MCFYVVAQVCTAPTNIQKIKDTAPSGQVHQTALQLLNTNRIRRSVTSSLLQVKDTSGVASP